jgi:hypothetical protein
LLCSVSKLFANFDSHSFAVVVETLYFVPDLSVENAKAFLLDFKKLCVCLFPAAIMIRAPYEGVDDDTIKVDEIYSRDLWRLTEVGNFRLFDEVIVIDIER